VRLVVSPLIPMSDTYSSRLMKTKDRRRPGDGISCL